MQQKAVSNESYHFYPVLVHLVSIVNTTLYPPAFCLSLVLKYISLYLSLSPFLLPPFVSLIYCPSVTLYLHLFSLQCIVALLMLLGINTSHSLTECLFVQMILIEPLTAEERIKAHNNYFPLSKKTNDFRAVKV